MSRSTVFAITAFSVMSFFQYQGLYNDPKKVESPLIGKEFPKFKLNDLFLNTAHDNDSFQDKKTIINVWASWCITCRVEHPYLMSLNKKGVPIIGLNYKDERNDALEWLSKFGNPYERIIHDYKGTLALDLGVTGAPETFLVQNGKIIAHYQGEINESIWNEVFSPIIEEKELF